MDKWEKLKNWVKEQDEYFKSLKFGEAWDAVKDFHTETVLEKMKELEG